MCSREMPFVQSHRLKLAKIIQIFDHHLNVSVISQWFHYIHLAVSDDFPQLLSGGMG